MGKQQKERDLDYEKCQVISASVSDANKIDTFSVRYPWFEFLIARYMVSLKSQPGAAGSVPLLPRLLLLSRAGSSAHEPLQPFEHVIKSCTSGRFDMFASIRTGPSNLFFGSKYYSFIELQSFSCVVLKVIWPEVRAADPMGCSQHLFHINHGLL